MTLVIVSAVMLVWIILAICHAGRGPIGKGNGWRRW